MKRGDHKTDIDGQLCKDTGEDGHPHDRREASGETSPEDSLISDFQPLELLEIHPCHLSHSLQSPVIRPNRPAHLASWGSRPSSLVRVVHVPHVGATPEATGKPGPLPQRFWSCPNRARVVGGAHTCSWHEAVLRGRGGQCRANSWGTDGDCPPKAGCIQVQLCWPWTHACLLGK